MEVEVWSDVVCPWCYIGKRRLEAALTAFPHAADVHVTWRSFELDPSAPAVREGDAASRLAAKYGMSQEQALASQTRLTTLAAQDGLEYHLDRTRAGNSFDAHRLLHFAHQLGLQDALKERLFRAYFTEAEPIGDRETLRRLAVETGLPDAEVRAVLESDQFAADVHADEAQARDYGVDGVPFFVVDARYGVSGAQSAEVLGQALAQAWAESHPQRVLTRVGGGADSAAACTDDQCAV